MRRHLRRNSRAGIANIDYGIGAVARQRHLHPFLRDVVNRIERIAHQIDQYLFGAHRISDHFNRVPNVNFQLHRIALKVVVHQPRRGFDRLRQIHSRHGLMALACKSLELADDRPHASASRADMRQIFRSLLDLAARQKDHRVIGERTDRCQRLIQLMRDAGRHLAQHRQLAGLHHFILR